MDDQPFVFVQYANRPVPSDAYVATCASTNGRESTAGVEGVAFVEEAVSHRGGLEPTPARLWHNVSLSPTHAEPCQSRR